MLPVKVPVVAGINSEFDTVTLLGIAHEAGYPAMQGTIVVPKGTLSKGQIVTVTVS